MLSPESTDHRNESTAYVTRALRLGIKTGDGEVGFSEYPRIFVLVDVADAFGALGSGSAAWAGGERSRSVVRSMEGRGLPLEVYTPPPPGMKVLLGLKHSTHQTSKRAFGKRGSCCEIVNINDTWKRLGISSHDMSV